MTLTREHLRLSPRQQRAYAHIDAAARSCRDVLHASIAAKLQAAGVIDGAYAAALANLRHQACVAVHFHPERIALDGQSVADGLLRGGVFKNQYETGISSGSPTAFAGGERDAWEQALFGDAYADIRFAAERPRYGALILAPHLDGPAPRFGSCYLVLRPAASRRCTFTWGGSNEPNALVRSGTSMNLEPVMSALLSDLEYASTVLGIAGLSLPRLLECLTLLRAPTLEPGEAPLGNVLDHFIEVQIHGPIEMGVDVSALVADPAFADSSVGALLEEISKRYGFELVWHPGFALPVADVPEHFRGYAIGPLARRVARRGLVDAASIGLAANAHRLRPAEWAELGAHFDALAAFRRLWHVLVQRGEPR